MPRAVAAAAGAAPTPAAATTRSHNRCRCRHRRWRAAKAATDDTTTCSPAALGILQSALRDSVGGNTSSSSSCSSATRRRRKRRRRGTRQRQLRRGEGSSASGRSTSRRRLHVVGKHGASSNVLLCPARRCCIPKRGSASQSVWPMRCPRFVAQCGLPTSTGHRLSTATWERRCGPTAAPALRDTTGAGTLADLMPWCFPCHGGRWQHVIVDIVPAIVICIGFHTVCELFLRCRAHSSVTAVSKSCR